MATINIGQFVKRASDPEHWDDRLFFQYDQIADSDPDQAEYIKTQLQDRGVDFDAFLRAYSDYLSQISEVHALRPLTEIKPEEKSFLVPVYLPDGCINILAGEGGIGKTHVWCDIVAAVTTGRMPFFVQPDMLPKAWTASTPQNVVVFSGEDSFKYVLRDRLDKCGANTDRIFVLDPDTDETPLCFDKFGYRRIERYMQLYRPALCVFDPVQSYLPSGMKISDRGNVRSVLQPLIALAEKYETTILIVMHANKTHGASGLNRIADSKDFPDMARSVLMLGYTDEKKQTIYLSHEKSNYSRFGKTALFSLGSGKPEFCGYTDKRDTEYVLENGHYGKPATARDTAKDFCLAYLGDGKKHLVHELEADATAKGISVTALRRARTALNQAGQIVLTQEGYGKDKKTFVALQS